MISNYNSFTNDTQNTKDTIYNKNPNNNLLIDKNNNINQGTKTNDKKVSFNNKVVQVNVESYKDYNKLNSYNEEEINENLQKKDKFLNYLDKKSLDKRNNNNNYNYNNNLVQIRPKKENECCVKICNK